MRRFAFPLAATILVACSASHECTPGESRACDAGACNARQFCGAEGRWSVCMEALTICDTGPSDASLESAPDALPFDGSSGGLHDAHAELPDTDPFAGDVFSPGACTWSIGPTHRLTSDVPGAKLLSPLSLGRDGVHFTWTSVGDRNVRVQEIGFDGTPLLGPRVIVPPPEGVQIAYGSVAESVIQRIAVVGPVRGSIVVPLHDDDTAAPPFGALYARRCVEVEALGADAFSMLCTPMDGSAGVTYRIVDGTGSTTGTSAARADANEAHRGTIHGGPLDGHMLLVSQDASGIVTAQHFDASGAPVAEAVTLPASAGAVRGVGPVAIEGGWLVALQVGAFGIATSTLDVDGHPTREPFRLPDVRSARGIYYGLATTSDDAMLVWTEWVYRDRNEVALHAQALSHDGFPRSAVLDVARFPAAGSAPDVIEAIGTPSGVVVVFPAAAESAPAAAEIYSALLSCVAP